MSAPLRTRTRSRYSSVLESALVGLGREDAVVQSTRKPRKKRRYDASESPIRGLRNAFSAPEQHPNAAGKGYNEEGEEHPFAHLKLLKSHRKKKKKRRQETQEEDDEASATFSPAVTRSAAKQKQKRHKRRHAGVLEMVVRTPVTRSMAEEKKKKWKRSSLEIIEDIVDQEEGQDEVVIQKKLFQSPEPTKKKRKTRIESMKQEKRVEKRGTRVEKKTKGQKEGVRVNRKAAVLKQWRVEWPPELESTRGSDVERAQLVLTGHVDGKSARFAVGKREGAMKFTSKEGEYVALSGKFDRDAARSVGIPRAAMELMSEGIPTFFFKRLLPFVHKSHDTAKHDKSGFKAKPAKKKASDADKYRYGGW